MTWAGMPHTRCPGNIRVCQSNSKSGVPSMGVRASDAVSPERTTQFPPCCGRAADTDLTEAPAGHLPSPGRYRVSCNGASNRSSLQRSCTQGVRDSRAIETGRRQASNSEPESSMRTQHGTPVGGGVPPQEVEHLGLLPWASTPTKVTPCVFPAHAVWPPFLPRALVREWRE
jgi:hypothetical protein